MLRNAIAPFVFVLTSAICTTAVARPIQISDMFRAVGVSNAQISPDGKTVLFVVSRWDGHAAAYTHELHSVDVLGKVDQLLLSHPLDAFSPRWSPDGKLIALLAPEGKPGTPLQIYITGRGGKAHRLTGMLTDVQEITWSPDSKNIAFVAADPPDEAQVQSQGGRFDAGENGDTVHAAAMPSQLWVIPAAGGAPTKLTTGPSNVSAENAFDLPSPQFAWSPDGKSIGFIRLPTANANDEYQAVVELIDVDTHTSKQLTPQLLLGGALAFSPDGHVAYLSPRDDTRVNAFEVQVVTASGGTPIVWMQSVDREIAGLRWMPDGSMLAGGLDHARVGLWLQTPDGQVTPLQLGDANPNCERQRCDVSVSASGSIAFVAAEPERPNDVYVMTTTGSAPQRITHYGDELAALDYGGNEMLEWDGPDGFREDGVITYPPGFSRDKKYPLVVLLHGAISAYTRRMDGGWPMPELLAARGYVVFAPNFRGSDNSGNAYQSAVFDDAVAGPGRDIMAGVKYVEGLGFIDTSREAVCGWSYGGLMTSWLTTQFHNWRAAVAGAAENDMLEQYADADGGYGKRYFFGGSPYVGDHMKDFVAQSPITYAKDVTTPTLIWATTDDPSVPMVQSFLMYRALKDRGVPVRFVLYPSSTHGPRDVVQAADISKLWLDWLDRYMK
ncbi:MAG TPA: S9 family peptidase [Gammaproteobacteria bacterium]|jgi:dipeptidyl aminopeptidase/acylaminoacyl peptidase